MYLPEIRFPVFYLHLTIFLLCMIGAQTLSAQQQKLLWIDGEANFTRMSYPDSIAHYIKLAKKTGFTGIVLDVKPITGEVLFRSTTAPMMKEWQGFTRTDSMDFLHTCITIAHAHGMKLYAALNIFVAGHNFFDRGLVYSGKAAWQSINYTDSGMVPITQLKHKYSAMTNPVLSEVRGHELSVLKELAAGYPLLDGLILDRVRYDDIQADFSDSSRSAFEKFSGKHINNFPGDIFTWLKDGKGGLQRKEGPLFKNWITWRASVIYTFIRQAREAVKKINPHLSFGDYTGAWYPLYYELGVNWASNKYDSATEYSWASGEYKNYGYAELLDMYTTGCYFYEVQKDEVEKLNAESMQRGEAAMGKGKEYWYSVEGSAEIAKMVTMGAVPVLGGLYVEQYKENPEQFIKAVKMCLLKTDGVMVFDMVHLINNNWWDVMKKGME